MDKKKMLIIAIIGLFLSGCALKGEDGIKEIVPDNLTSLPVAEAVESPADLVSDYLETLSSFDSSISGIMDTPSIFNKLEKVFTEARVPFQYTKKHLDVFLELRALRERPDLTRDEIVSTIHLKIKELRETL